VEIDESQIQSRPLNRFERLRDKYLSDHKHQGHSSWVPVGHDYVDGELVPNCLKNTLTGEIVSNEGWD